MFLSKKLRLPALTIQRRRKRLEREFLDKEYSLCLEIFGQRRIDFFISTTNGKTDVLASDILSLDQVTKVGKSIGQRTIDLRVETVIRNNHELLDLLEKLKAMDGVRDAMWSKIVKILGNKMSVPSHVIDQL